MKSVDIADPILFHKKVFDIPDDLVATKGTPRLKPFLKMVCRTGSRYEDLVALRPFAGHTSGAEQLVVRDSQHIPSNK